MIDPHTAATYRVQRLARRRSPFAVVRVGPKGTRTLVASYDNELAANKIRGLLTRLEGLKYE